MIVDTSSIVAILRMEAGFETIIDVLETHAGKAMSAAGYVELCAVMGRSAERRRVIDEVLESFSVELAPFDASQARAAATAYQRYGRGSGHPAKLNMGDVYSYALALTRNEPLLFVGDDFVHTDIAPALRSSA